MPPRRKQKPPEYEPDPVISPPKVASIEDDRVEKTPTKAKVIPDKLDENLPIVSNTTVKHRGFEEIYSKVADKYKPPPVVTSPKVPEIQPEKDDKPTIAHPKVTNHEKNVTTPIDETVPGWGKVFGHKEKTVKTVENRDA